MTLKMQKIEPFKGTLKVLGSGLHIGGPEELKEPGAIDAPIIRHPITNVPYVPGSSIKGKIRSLLEGMHCQDTSGRTGKPCTCGDCLVCQIFGCGDAKKTKTPTRVVFRDCQPTEDTRKTWDEAMKDSEIKPEVLIDRRTGTSFGKIGPRKMERIPANSDFEFRFSLRIFEGDSVKEFFNFIAEGFELLEKHYLGGLGSRGYGEVAVFHESGKPMHEYLKELAK